MKLYVVRHGQIDGNVEDRMYTRTDKPLNTTGRSQVREIAKSIADLEYDFIICSPLLRAKQTCNILNRQEKPVLYDDRLMERDGGSLEGLLTSEFDYSNYWNYTKNKSYPGCISIVDFYHGIWDFLADIKEKYTDHTILLVTHNGVCRAIHTYFHQVPSDGNTEIYSYNNAELREYDL